MISWKITIKNYFFRYSSSYHRINVSLSKMQCVVMSVSVKVSSNNISKIHQKNSNFTICFTMQFKSNYQVECIFECNSISTFYDIGRHFRISTFKLHWSKHNIVNLLSELVVVATCLEIIFINLNLT